MKLSKKELTMVSFTLFSMFFGAGNLIFPPFLGQNAGSQTLGAVLGFLLTAVVLPVLGVVVVARFDGPDRLARQVGPRFGLIFTVLIYLSIGPGLAIPRAASVPFEMAVAPHMSSDANLTVWMLAYSLTFFLVSLWLCLNPGKIVEWLGVILTPMLLILLLVLFGGFLLKGETLIAAPQSAYASAAFFQGFVDGYQTMDAIAGLSFGLVVVTMVNSFGMTEKKAILRCTAGTGTFAGIILAIVYLMLTWMGMCSSGVYPIQENGAWTLRCIVYQIFGDPGAILLAAIFTLACLTTCVGLITAVAQYFASLWKGISYKGWVYIVTGFSFVTSNLGLNTILSISVPILNAIYPVAIVLILMGLSDGLWKKLPVSYGLIVGGTAVVSVVYALDSAGISLALFRWLPLYDLGFGWVSVAAVMLLLSIGHKLLAKK